MEKHMEMVDGCLLLTKLVDDPTASVADVCSAIRTIMGDSVTFEFPAAMKQRLVARRLRDMVKALQSADVDKALPDLLATLSPFASRPPGGSDPEELGYTGDMGVEPIFDALEPTLAALDKQWKEKVLLSTKIFVLDVLQELVKGGCDFSTTASKVCQAFLRMCEDKLVEMDEVPAAMEKSLVVLRALVSLLEFSPQSYDAEEVMALKTAGSSPKGGILADALLILEGNAWYKDLLQNFLQTMADSSKCAPGLVEMEDKLKKSEPLSIQTMDSAVEAIELIKNVKGVVRQGMTEPLQKVCRQQLGAAFRRLSDQEGSGESMDDGLLLKASHAFELASSLWPQEEVMQEAHSWLIVINQAQQDAAKVTRCISLCQADVLTDGTVDVEKVAVLRSAMSDCPGLVASEVGELNAIVAFAKAMLQHMAEVSINKDDVATCQSVLKLIPDSGTKATSDATFNVVKDSAVVMES